MLAHEGRVNGIGSYSKSLELEVVHEAVAV
jgi:hypothetical protein